MQYRDGHISTCFIKTLVIYSYCAYYALCQLSNSLFFYRYLLFIYLCSLLIIVFHLFCSCLSSFIFFLNFSSLFVVQKKKINSDPGLYSRYLDPTYHHHLCKSINIIQKTAPTLSQYRSERPITIIDIVG